VEGGKEKSERGPVIIRKVLFQKAPRKIDGAEGIMAPVVLK